MEQRGNENYEEAMPAFRAVQLSRSIATPLPMPVAQPLRDMKPTAAQGPRVDLGARKAPASPARDLQFKVPSMPSYYPVERTAGVIKDVAVSMIASRIAENLRVNSVTTTYHPNDGNVVCATSSMLEFCIQLWQKKSKIIVEVQRIEGDTMELHSFCKQLFKAIRTGEQTSHATEERPVLPAHQESTPVDMSADESMQIVLRLLESTHVDQNRLGLESLCTMTDPSIVGSERAALVSRVVVFAEGGCGERVQSALAPFLAVRQEPEIGASRYSHSALHQLVLVALANALQMVHAEVSDLDMSVSFWSQITERLCHNIRVAHLKPQEACSSTKCIRILSSCPGVNASEIREAVEQAETFGKSYHAALEQESRNLSQFVQ